MNENEPKVDRAVDYDGSISKALQTVFDYLLSQNAGTATQYFTNETFKAAFKLTITLEQAPIEEAREANKKWSTA